MASLRDPDALTIHLLREQARVLERINEFARGGGAACLADARRIVRALADAEAQVLYPALSRVALKPETQRLLDDSRTNREQQLEAIDMLARKRSARLRKLASVQLCELVQHHGEQHTSQLIPVLSSKLPRVVYRSIVHTFVARYEGHVQECDTAQVRAIA